MLHREKCSFGCQQGWFPRVAVLSRFQIERPRHVLHVNRVMVEDSPVQEMPSTPQSVPDPPLQMARTGEFHKGDGARDSDSRDHCAEGESASAFGMFADVRRGLYQLCLALLLGAQNRIRASGATSTGRPPDPQARGTQDLSSSPCPANGRVKPSHRLPTGHRHNHGRSRSLINDALLANHQGMLKATDARDLARSLEHASNEAPEQHDGDEWHIKEFRRVGDTVKPFVVICQVHGMSVLRVLECRSLYQSLDIVSRVLSP